MTILSKACKPDHFQSHNSLKLSFTNIRGLRSNFVDCESFLEPNSPDILALRETILDDSTDSSTNVFVLGDFNVHHKDWLTYSGGTDRPGELCYNFSLSNDLTQMVNFPTRIPDCDSHSPALLDLFISSDATICSTMVFPPLRNSDHRVVSVSIDFLSNSQRDAPLYRIA